MAFWYWSGMVFNVVITKKNGDVNLYAQGREQEADNACH